MTVSYLVCHLCGGGYPDMSDCSSCEGCEANFCSDCTDVRTNIATDVEGREVSCTLCRYERLGVKNDIVGWLVRRAGLSMELAEQLYLYEMTMKGNKRKRRA